MATKQQVLNYIQNKMNDCSKGSHRYLFLGVTWIEVNEDRLTPTALQTRFPELFP